MKLTEFKEYKIMVDLDYEETAKLNILKGDKEQLTGMAIICQDVRQGIYYPALLAEMEELAQAGLRLSAEAGRQGGVITFRINAAALKRKCRLDSYLAPFCVILFS